MQMIKQKRKKLALLLLGFVLTLVLAWVIGKPLVDLVKDPEIFKEMMVEQGAWGRVLMIVVIFLQVIIAWIPGEVFEIGAGFAFGFWEGSALVLLGSCLASYLILLLVHRYGRRIVYTFFSKEKIDALPFLHDQRKLNRFVFIAFFIPGSPKDVLTYAIGLTDMKISHFLVLSTVGRIPSVITSTITGNAIGDESYIFAIFSFIFTLCISALGLYIYGRFANHKQKKKELLCVKEA